MSAAREQCKKWMDSEDGQDCLKRTLVPEHSAGCLQAGWEAGWDAGCLHVGRELATSLQEWADAWAEAVEH